MNKAVRAAAGIARRGAKFVWIYLLFLSGALRRAKRRLRADGAVVVLTFHRVLPDPEYAATSSQAGIVVRENTFASLCAYLQRSCEVLDLHPEKPVWPHSSSQLRVALTFDDGWQDNFTTALPITRKYGIPWTVFVCPGLAGRSFPFWPERVMAQRRIVFGLAATERYIAHLKELTPQGLEDELAKLPQIAHADGIEPNNATMSWESMCLLQENGVRLGSHTDTHQILTQLDPAAIENELKRSKESLERAFGVPCRAFAYPNGNVTPAIRGQVKLAGYTLAFTTRPGAWMAESDSLLIPRLNISEQKLTGWRGGFSRAAFEYHVFWKAARQTYSPVRQV